MVRGCLLAESLRVGAVIEVPGLTLIRVARRDVSTGATSAQPSEWTFLEFQAPDAVADQLADALATALRAEGGWYADFEHGDDHVIVFAGRVFRYRRGDREQRAEVEAYALAVGVPPHQTDWGD